MIAVDALVAGAGPGGCAAALALAASGLRVRIVDPQLPADRRLSGEWLHPGGVAALGRLGIPLYGPDFVHNRGFLVYPGDGSPPIELPYPDGTAVSMHHGALTRVLRQALAKRPGVDLGPPDRILGTTPDGAIRTGRDQLRADLIVGADGRGSVVGGALRKRVRHDTPSALLSHMAGLLLPGASLPVEGFAHIFLGGPGAALVYRVAADAVRVCLDVPRGHPRAPEVYEYLPEAYRGVLPPSLWDGCLSELAARRVQWAANRFRRRTFYGHGPYALVGDAVGYTHPLAALGMTMAILDGEALGDRPDPVEYARERRRRSWAAERLAAATHRALTARDPASLALRSALFTLWRDNPRERQRMMGLLSVQDDRRLSLTRSVGRIARTAVGDSPLPTLPSLGAWLCWLAGPAAGIPPQRVTTPAVRSPRTGPRRRAGAVRSRTARLTRR